MNYYVNKNAQSNGDHEVHTGTCSFLPTQENRIHLGDFSGCAAAVVAAKTYYSQSNGCYYCANACHTS